MSTENPTDEQLWSWVDRDAPELDAYLKGHPEAASRVDDFRAAIGRFEDSDPQPKLPSRIGEYRIRGLLGRGGMGVVYDAEQEHPKRSVALKVLPEGMASDRRRLELFRREADALARLSHPGIAVIYEVGGGSGERPYIAMERIDGRPLDAYVSAEKPTRRQLVTLVRKVASAVGHAHDHGVVHRDIKPHNILINTQDEPVVVDFGLARLQDEEVTQASLASSAGSLLGTLPYMSPEQVAGRVDLDHRSDVYSLGVVLFELVVGRRPQELQGLSLVEAARCIQLQPPHLRGKGSRALRGDLRTIVLKALEKDAGRRYTSAGTLAADLQRYLDGRPIEALRPGLLRQTTSFVRRHWVATTLSAATLAVALAVLFPVRLPIPLLGAWLEGAPFEDIRWVLDTPQVQLDGEWYALVAIEDLKSAYVIGFCQQHTEGKWRKRFSEDLVQVLHRLGIWHTQAVDLTLRDLTTGELEVREDVPLDSGRRRAIRDSRNSWPWIYETGSSGRYAVTYLDAPWVLVSVDTLQMDTVSLNVISNESLYDLYCDRVGHSPPDSIDFVLQNSATGAIQEFRNIPRMHADQVRQP
jgi:serine/threonine protein kinase